MHFCYSTTTWQDRLFWLSMFFFQEAKFKEREDKMQAKNTELEESLVQFSKYLQENDAKKARAFKKAADEERQCEERIKEAEDLVRRSMTNLNVK